jgi:hypothetical protein
MFGSGNSFTNGRPTLLKPLPASGITANVQQIMQQDYANNAPTMSDIQSYLDRVAAESRAGGGATSTSTTNNSYLLDMGETVDIKDGGLALGAN